MALRLSFELRKDPASQDAGFFFAPKMGGAARFRINFKNAQIFPVPLCISEGLTVDICITGPYMEALCKLEHSAEPSTSPDRSSGWRRAWQNPPLNLRTFAPMSNTQKAWRITW